jgi:hypothetical protein
MKNRFSYYVAMVIILLAIFSASACAKSVPTPVPTPTLTPTSTPTPTPEAKSVKLTDPSDDLFDKSGNPIKDQPYLDIVEAEVTTSGSDCVARIKLNGSPPIQTPDPQIFLEWTIYVDADNDPLTGGSWPLVVNNLRFEYLARLMLLDSNYRAQLYDNNTGKSVDIKYAITDNVIELRWPQTFNQTDTFNFVLAAKKYGKRGAGSAFMLADKAPNEGYYNFPNGYVQPPQSGLPTASLEATNATVFYNPGNEKIAKAYGDAFDFAYIAIGKELGTYPKKRFTLYIYITQEDLVRGLQTLGNFSPESSAYFKTGGAPRPINYILHVWPGCDWHGITHEYTHTILEEISGDAYKSIKWLDEGLADYLAHSTVLDTKYKEGELSWGQSRLAVVRQAFQQSKSLSLLSISTERQWSANHADPVLYDLQYAEAYAVVANGVQKYGLDKCVSILNLMEQGVTQEAAVQQALGVSLSQFETDFKISLGQ